MQNISTIPRTWAPDVTVGAAQYEAGSVGAVALAANIIGRRVSSGPQQIATTGVREFPFIAPSSGTLAGIKFYGQDALAANDTNYITFSAINKGQAGAGTTDLLAATDANTTKATGGTAIAAYTPRNLNLHATPANLVLVAGDLVILTVTPTGTLANVIDFAGATLNMTPS